MLIIVKIAVKKFHLQKMPPLSSPAKGQWGLRAREKSIEHPSTSSGQVGHGDKVRQARKGRAEGSRQETASRYTS